MYKVKPQNASHALVILAITIPTVYVLQNSHKHTLLLTGIKSLEVSCENVRPMRSQIVGQQAPISETTNAWRHTGNSVVAHDSRRESPKILSPQNSVIEWRRRNESRSHGLHLGV